MDFPKFRFDLCSSLQKATLQKKVGTKWLSLKIVSGKRSLSICPDDTYPFYVSASGEDKTGKNTEMRLVFIKTNRVSSFTQFFSVEFRK